MLETAGRLFHERGYECVGINEIIATAEIAKATFYQHFPGKEALCAAWLRREAEESEKGQRELLAEDRPVAGKVAAKFDGMAAMLADEGFHGCPFCVTATMVSADSEVTAVIRAFREATRAFWQKLAAASGRKPAAARDLGDAWMLLYTGAITEARNLGSVWPVEQARKAALRLLAAA
nr:TetR/AcrR family transcriptional regulator [Luteolibacter marinus]